MVQALDRFTIDGDSKIALFKSGNAILEAQCLECGARTRKTSKLMKDVRWHYRQCGEALTRLCAMQNDAVDEHASLTAQASRMETRIKVLSQQCEQWLKGEMGVKK